MDKKSHYQLIDQAFLPAKEIEIPELFSGRKEEIVQGLHALRSQGANICIYGKRGVGKSSIAKQLRLVASGYPTLTDMIGHPELFDQDLFCMPSVYFYCDDTIQNANDLFRKLLSDRDSLDGIARYNDGIILRRTKEKRTTTARLTFNLLQAAETDECEIENIVAELDPVSAFKAVTSEIVDSANSTNIVVVIDEFERISSKIGIASILRTCPQVKFILVGVSEDVRSLIVDHESIRRQLSEGTIRINPMTSEMLVEILKRAEALIQGIIFEDEVITYIVAMSDGYPHWVHLLGRWSCIDAIEHDDKTVKIPNLLRAIERLVKNEPLYEELYMEITKGEKTNELILKIIASEKQEKINPQEIYSTVKSYGISHGTWHNFIARLVSNNMLNKIENNFTSFKDMRFKIYVKIRPPLYPENDLSRRTYQIDSTYIGYLVKDFMLPTNVLSYLSHNETLDFYINASKYAPIEFICGSPNEKPLIYDSKGLPFKYKKRK
jgi:hypothetical protein